jgi:hypothetical protein
MDDRCPVLRVRPPNQRGLRLRADPGAASIRRGQVVTTRQIVADRAAIAADTLQDRRRLRGCTSCGTRRAPVDSIRSSADDMRCGAAAAEKPSRSPNVTAAAVDMVYICSLPAELRDRREGGSQAAHTGRRDASAWAETRSRGHSRWGRKARHRPDNWTSSEEYADM